MKLFNFLTIAACGYLLGSLNFSIIISKYTAGFDVRTRGSGNAGLSNVQRNLGNKRTILVLLGDVLKCVVALLIGMYFFGDMGKLISGIFVILGHVYPLYFSFRGGKGVLVGATMLAMFDIRIFGIAALLFLIAVIITRYISVGSMIAAISFPISTYFIYDNKIYALTALFIGIWIVYLHRSNIKKLIHGNENKFSFSKKKDD